MRGPTSSVSVGPASERNPHGEEALTGSATRQHARELDGVHPHPPVRTTGTAAPAAAGGAREGQVVARSVGSGPLGDDVPEDRAVVTGRELQLRPRGARQ